MKNLSCSIVLILSFSFFLLPRLTVQAYPSIFGTNTTAWIFEWGNLDFNALDSIYVSGGRLIDGKIYKRIDRYMSNPFASTNGFTGALLREDTVAGKVWYRNVSGDTTEYLAYQYGLQPNDSFDVAHYGPTAANATRFHQPWSKVDSVNTINGNRYVYFNSSYRGEPFTLIEGIAYNTGIIYNYESGIMGGQYLLCSYKDGVKTSFENKRYAGICHPAVGAIETISATDRVRLYPNPVTDVVNINNRTGQPIQRLELSSSDGRLIRYE